MVNNISIGLKIDWKFNTLTLIIHSMRIAKINISKFHNGNYFLLSKSVNGF